MARRATHRPPAPVRLLAILIAGLALATSAEAALGPFSLFGRERGQPTIYQPLGWLVINPTWPGENPYDVEAVATFVHEDSATVLRTDLFVSGPGRWQFRFTGTLPGRWTYSTQSADPQLHGLTGEVVLADDPVARGFVTGDGNQWAWSASGRAFIPALVMWRRPGAFAGDLASIDDAIETFFEGHGFNGLHIQVHNEWYALGAWKRGDHSSRDPDGATFEAIEQAIAKSYTAGGMVHLWFTGDCAHDTCSKWGAGSTEEARLLRYIAARLGPLPGWTMGYGFDINEDHQPAEVDRWFETLDGAMDWPHMLGARTEKDFVVDGMHRTDGVPFCRACNFESWVDHKPGYGLINDIVKRNPDEPCFLEDRYRMRNPPLPKDLSMDETRRMLWHSALAGGPAAIWGNTIGAALPESSPYPEPQQIRTWARFWDARFRAGLSTCNQLTNGLCARSSDRDRFFFHFTDASRLTVDLRTMIAPGQAVLVDTERAYAEIDLGSLDAANHTLTAPYRGDWAIAVEPGPPIHPDSLFEDGFEEGDLDEWDASSPLTERSRRPWRDRSREPRRFGRSDR